MYKNDITAKKSFYFAIEIIRLFKHITKSQKEYVLSKQLLRSGTAVGALVRESRNAESKKDFIHKLAIAQKECDETLYWLDLLIATDYLDHKMAFDARNECSQLLKLIRSSIIT